VLENVKFDIVRQYIDRENMVKKKNNERYCMIKLRLRTKLTLPENSTKKYKKIVNSR
jgi:hypothetical protein